MARFTADKRIRFVALVEAGQSIEDACAAVDVSRTTISKWRARGRKGTDADAVAFLEELEAAQDAADDEPLEGSDLIRLLERQAKRGSVRAMEILLRRNDERNRQLLGRNPFDELDADPMREFDALYTQRVRGED